MTEAQNLSNLIIYRNILKDSLVNKLQHLLYSGDANLRHELASDFIIKAEQLGLEGNIVKSYLLQLISQDENIFSSIAEETNGKVGESLFNTALEDIKLLKNFINSDAPNILDLAVLDNYHPSIPQSNDRLSFMQEYFINSCFTPEQITNKLVSLYARYGYGEMANYAAFRWDDNTGLIGVQDYDTVQLDDIIGYDRQKDVLIKNTEAFISGKPANNVLLAGARGTGKSSSVKALVNHFFSSGLRLVEVSKNQITQLYEIMNLLRNRRQKFIIFLDDLSFEEFEIEYKYLKSVIDGGVESKPLNVIIFATSNRRHIVKELWNDRNENSSEVHRNDTLNEKISLSDRFGITITFPQPSQDEYIKIVEEIAKKHKLKVTPSTLHSEALKWEMTHSGRSGRLAKQFVSHIMGTTKAIS